MKKLVYNITVNFFALCFVLGLAMVWGLSTSVKAQVSTTDSAFVRGSRPVNFIVNRIDVSDGDKRWITDTLMPQLRDLGCEGIVMGRAAASPEGPRPNNARLANSRRASVDVLLSKLGIDTNRIRYDVVTEDYGLLRTLMSLAHDADLAVVDSLLRHYGSDEPRLKEAMRRYGGGKMWQRLLKQYYPKLRAVRIMALDLAKERMDTMRNFLPAIPIGTPISTSSAITLPHIAILFPHRQELPCGQRRELLGIKTNLLFDFAYMPGYERFCPIPNVALEYYPLHGHFTYGASFDCPWWQHYDAHKYFQVRNYQIHTRYYLRSGDISLRKPGEGAAFKGLFLSAYAHANIYNICFDAKRGWEGEGVGAGLGIGYVVPLDKKEHWRLELGLQAGYFYTPYDPYQWRCPIDADSDRQLYYYKWYGDAKDFKRRQHRYSWIGPTRAEITLSYDLIYRKKASPPKKPHLQPLSKRE